MKRRDFLQHASALSLGAGTWPALAQSPFPSKTIRYIVPVSAGGGSDMVGRTVTERWGQLLKQGFVVDNQSGGGGVIACQTTMRSPADGYTLMQGYVATHGTSPATRKLPYDPIKDFTAVGMIGATPNVLVVPSSLPVKNLREFLAYIAKTPNLSYGSSGQGSLTHLSMELLKQTVHADLVHVPYRGIAPAISDLIGGQTQAMLPGLAAALPHIKSGRMRALAVTGLQRHAQLKDVPTMDELGYKGFDAQQWYGVVGPAGLPGALVKQLNDSLNQVLRSPELHDKLSVEAIEPMPMGSEQFSAHIGKEVARWSQLAKDRKIQLDG